MKTLLAVLLFSLLLAVPAAWAKTIVLEPGQSYTSGENNIVCMPGGSGSAAPISRTECQYWDNFNKQCLYQRKIITYGHTECVEECQHWDDFNHECRFATSCAFYAAQGRFVRTVCDEFDTFNATCVRTRQELIDIRR